MKKLRSAAAAVALLAAFALCGPANAATLAELDAGETLRECLDTAPRHISPRPGCCSPCSSPTSPSRLRAPRGCDPVDGAGQGSSCCGWALQCCARVRQRRATAFSAAYRPAGCPSSWDSRSACGSSCSSMRGRDRPSPTKDMFQCSSMSRKARRPRTGAAVISAGSKYSEDPIGGDFLISRPV
jgi:hypothetical protein